jgi:CRISPR-associated endonuclease/helicase Cas3
MFVAFGLFMDPERNFYAHTLPDQPPANWETLEKHLQDVSELASAFAKSFGAEEWGHVLGLWHDLGKYSPEFQQYLAGRADGHEGEETGKVDHSTYGAKHALEKHPLFGYLLAYVISGHHSGLLDFHSDTSCLEKRLGKRVFDAAGMPDSLRNAGKHLEPPEVLHSAMKAGESQGFAVSFFVRMLFSCLVDADFLATEAFMNPKQAGCRPELPPGILQEMLRAVEIRLKRFPPPGNEVDRRRKEVLEDCEHAAELSPGFFTLTVPTGGGKTLSSLSFALRHAEKHDLRRVVYVAPFTSIIEQNADVYRDVFRDLPEEVLVEHHSSLEPRKETTRNRLASENWDAPMVVTTSVQFYESLFANRTSKVRKLHRLANSVIILDEAQTLPVEYLKPCLAALRELVERYGATVVLCTATQPAIRKHPDFEIGLECVREIIQDVPRLFRVLKRTEVEQLGVQTDAELASRLMETHSALCVVNSRKHAQKLYQALGEGNESIHLSALMCPAHRTEKLREIRKLLDRGDPVRVVSTQLVEAGVDVDFPVVFRSMAGLDSIAQAAGRCNRHGRLPNLGKVFLFDSENRDAEKYFQETANVARQILGLDLEPLSEEAAEKYFRAYFYGRRADWDQHEILRGFHLQQKREAPFLFQFANAAENFRIIRSSQQSVIIPYDETSRDLVEELRNPSIPLHRCLMRGLQRYMVSIYPNQLEANRGEFEWVREEFPVLLSPEQHYSDDLGLTLSNEEQPIQTLIT